MSPSEIHAAVRLAVAAHLAVPQDEAVRPALTALKEFLAHGGAQGSEALRAAGPRGRRRPPARPLPLFRRALCGSDEITRYSRPRLPVSSPSQKKERHRAQVDLRAAGGTVESDRRALSEMIGGQNSLAFPS